MIKRSPFAGTWYPGTRAKIIETLDGFGQQAQAVKKLRKKPTSGVVPHAGWAYSGPVAYEVWKSLADNDPDTVVLFGGHLHSHQRPMIFLGEGFETPLGNLMLDRDVLMGLQSSFRFKEIKEEHWTPENSVEVQLPMIQHLLPRASLVVLLTPPRDVILDVVHHLTEVLRFLGRKAIFVGSTDLTHYGPRYGHSPQGSGPAAVKWVKDVNDMRFIQSLLELNALGCIDEGLSCQSACCPGSAASAVTAARLNGSECGELLSHIASCEAFPMDEAENFVGYASVVF